MALNLVHLRSLLCSRCCVLQAAISIKERNFADDIKKKNNLYEALGLKSSATPREIKKAYYDLTFKYHPDKNEDSEDAATKFREVTEAYEILGNYSLRKKYDKGIPITKVKKMARPVVNHKVQFQEFYDSRSVSHSDSASDSRLQDIKDLSSYTKEKERRKKKPEEENFPEKNEHAAVQWVVTIFFIILIILNRS